MICILSFSHLHLCRKKSYRILSFFKVIFYQKANVFLFYQHLTMKRGNYIIAHSFYKIDSFDSDCKLYVIQTEKIRRKCTIFSLEHFTLQHILLPGTLWGVSSVPFGIPFCLPVLFYNRSSSQFIICK